MNLYGAGQRLVWEVVNRQFNCRARRAVRGIAVLRRSYEYVLVMAALEGSRDGEQQPYYEAYVDALQILGMRAMLVARSL